MAGLENAKRKGKRLGRKSVLGPSLYEEIKKLKAKGLSNRAIGRQLKIGESVIRRKLKNEK